MCVKALIFRNWFFLVEKYSFFCEINCNDVFFGDTHFRSWSVIVILGQKQLWVRFRNLGSCEVFFWIGGYILSIKSG